MTRVIAPLFVLLVAACGGGAMAPNEPLGQQGAMKAMKMPDTDESTYGPLEVGRDWASYRKLSRKAFPSKTHGGRWVEVYVNDVGAEAYLGDGAFPEGTVIVKTSFEGSPEGAKGPIFVMRKEAAGYAPDHEDWSYAIHWAEPTPKQREMLGGPIYWRGKSPKVGYCYSCHDNYDRAVGGIPREALAR
jgi:hypothetical protein